MTEESPSRTVVAARLVIMGIALAVGIWVMFQFEIHPTPNHCPESEKFVCPGHNWRNLIPALAATVAGTAVAMPLLYGFERARSQV